MLSDVRFVHLLRSKSRLVTVNEILEGTYKMPYSQVRTWVTLQRKDPVISKLVKLIEVGQKPKQKRTGGNNTILKNLHSQFIKGNLKINSSGLVTVTHPDNSGTTRNLIVVPSPLFPGLVYIYAFNTLPSTR